MAVGSMDSRWRGAVLPKARSIASSELPRTAEIIEAPAGRGGDALHPKWS